MRAAHGEIFRREGAIFALEPFEFREEFVRMERGQVVH